MGTKTTKGTYKRKQTAKKLNRISGKDERKDAMPGDPQECRLEAERCLRLAEDAADHDNRVVLSQMADQWMRLAKDFENANAFQAMMNDIDAARILAEAIKTKNGEPKEG